MISTQRIYVIDESLKIERNLSIILSNLLFIQDIDKSKSLGNKSSSLAFNTKVDILLDSEFISEIDRKKFQLFMEIRNQFAHNIKCTTFLDCLNIVDGCESRLNRYYKVKGQANEEYVQLQIENLIKDINSIIDDCQVKIIEGLEEFINSELFSKGWEELIKSLINNITNLELLIDFEIDPKNIKRLKNKLFTQIIDTAAKTLEKRMPDLKNRVSKRKLKPIE